MPDGTPRSGWKRTLLNPIKTHGMKDKPTNCQADLSRRRNHVHAAYVNATLIIKESIGPRRAETILAGEGGSQEVIARTLNGSCKVR